MEKNPLENLIKIEQLESYTHEVKNYIKSMGGLSEDEINKIVSDSIKGQSSEVISSTPPENQEVGAIWLKLL
jgi:hypothetical protein